MLSVRISSSAHFFLNRTAYFFALMLFTRFELVTYLHALVIGYQTDFLFRHEFFLQSYGVIHLVAFNCLLRLPTLAFDLDRGLTKHALTIVTSFCALMSTTRQKSFARLIASRDRFRARSSRSTYQFFNCVVPTWTVFIS